MSLISLFGRVPRCAAMLCLLAPAWSQIALVHVTACAGTALPGSGCQIPVSGSGHLLVVGIRLVGATTTVTSIADDAQNPYVQAAGSRAVDTNSSSSIEIWYARNSAAGATTVTITPSAPVIGGAVIWEFSGLDTQSPLDQTAALSDQSTATTVSGPAVTTTSANEVVISISATQNALAGAVSNGFTNDASLFGGGWAHLITSLPGTYFPYWTASSAGSYASSSVSFRNAAPPTSTSCDVNGDGVVNAVDVQLITNMEINASGFPCSANIGGVLYCTDAARQIVIKAALLQGCHFITLNWAPSPSAGVIGYNIYRGTLSGNESSTPLNGSSPVTGTTFTDAGTTSGITYFYIIRATDGVTQSPPSQEVSASTL